MSLLHEIRDDLTNPDKGLTNTLRKAKILASSMKFPEFKQWLKNELEGYGSGDKLPEYRSVMVQNIGLLAGPLGSMVKNSVIPTSALPEELKEKVDWRRFTQNVGELEALANSANETLISKWPTEAVLIAQQYIHMSGGLELIEAKQVFTRSTIAGILDNIKNKLLDFILSIDEFSFYEEGKEMDKENIEKARNVFNVNIYGNYNTITNAESITQNHIQKNDIASLIDYFKENRVSESDLEKLKKSIKEDGELKSEGFGDKVKSWIGNMLQKASEGSWNVALQVAPALITEAIKKYYGI